MTVSATFMLTLGLELWLIILGLIIGGGCAAPLAAYAPKRIPPPAHARRRRHDRRTELYGLVRQFG